jgi:hypothetical protein
MEQLANYSAHESPDFALTYPDTVQDDYDYSAVVPSGVESPTLFSDQELATYTLELQAIRDGCASNRDKTFFQAERRLEMARRGWMDVDHDSPKAREQLHALFDKLGNIFPGVSRGREFNATNESVDESRKLLRQLPFVKDDDLIKYSAPTRLIIDGKQHVPLNAVIGAEGIESWAGRGEKNLKDGKPSIDVIREYAARGKYDGSGWMLDARVVNGSDGKAYLYLSSAHRAAAAKLRGDKSIIVDSVILSSKPWEFVVF